MIFDQLNRLHLCFSWAAIHISLSCEVLFVGAQQSARGAHQVPPDAISHLSLFMGTFLLLKSIFSSFFRYQFFLQLKQDVFSGRLRAPNDTLIELAALSLQCESFCYGDDLLSHSSV